MHDKTQQIGIKSHKRYRFRLTFYASLKTILWTEFYCVTQSVELGSIKLLLGFRKEHCKAQFYCKFWRTRLHVGYFLDTVFRMAYIQKTIVVVFAVVGIGDRVYFFTGGSPFRV